MSIESAIRSMLLADSDISDSVTADGVQRIFPGGFAPQDSAYPNIAVHLAGGSGDLALDGPTGYRYVTIEVDVFDHDIDDLIVLCESVFNRAHGFRGTVGGVVIHKIQASEPVDLPDETAYALDPPIFRRQLTLEVEYSKE